MEIGLLNDPCDLSNIAYIAFYGVIFLFNKNAAYSNLRIWQSTAMAAAFAYSTFVCVRIKLYIMIGILSAGMIGYLTIEILEWNRKKNEKNTTKAKKN